MFTKPIKKNELLEKKIRLFEQHAPSFTKQFPKELISLILEYTDISTLSALKCPATGLLLQNPIYIHDARIAPLIYDRSALSHPDFLQFAITNEQIHRSLFMKNLINFFQQQPAIENDQNSETDYVSIRIDHEEEKTNLSEVNATLFRLLRGRAAVRNNLAQALLLECEDAKKRKQDSIDLVNMIENFPFPVIENPKRQYERICCNLLYINRIDTTRNLKERLSVYFIMLILPMTAILVKKIGKIKTKHPQYTLLLSLLTVFNLNNQVQIFTKSYHYHRDLYRSLMTKTNKCFYLFSLLSNTLAGQVALDGTFSSQTEKWFLLAFNFLLSTFKAHNAACALDIKFHERSLIKPLSKHSLLSLSLASLSVLNLAFMHYYVIRDTQEVDWYKKVMITSAIAQPFALLPMIDIASRKSADICVTAAKSLMKHPTRFFKPSTNSEGFHATLCIEKTGSLISKLSYLGNALLMGLFAFFLTENPLCAAIAAIAAINEMSIKDVVNESHSRFRL